MFQILLGLEDPIQGQFEEIKYRWRCMEAEWKELVAPTCSLPAESEFVPVLWVYRHLMESVLSTVPSVLSQDGTAPSFLRPDGDGRMGRPLTVNFRHRPTSIDDLQVSIHNTYSVTISAFLHYLDCEARSFNI
jgi:hypothetical protein